MAGPQSKRSRSAAEATPMEKARRSAQPAAAKPRTRTAKPKPTTAAPPPNPTPTPAPPAGRRLWPALILAVLVAVAAAAAALFLLVRGDDSPQQIRPGVPAEVSSDGLALFASSREAPVYWAGRVPARKLELTTTRAGTFVRYLALSAPIGDSQPALTIATYPLRNAYATATRRAGGEQMVSRRLPAGGIAVWSRAQPTSIYLAFQGVPHLVEVYAPTRAEARKFALSERIRPVL